MKKLFLGFGLACLCLLPLSVSAQECTEEAVDGILDCAAAASVASCIGDSGCTADDVNKSITIDYLVDSLLGACCDTPEEAEESEEDSDSNKGQDKKKKKKANNCVKKLQKQLRSRSGKRILPGDVRQEMLTDVAEKLAEVKEFGSCVLDDDSDDDSNDTE